MFLTQGATMSDKIIGRTNIRNKDFEPVVGVVKALCGEENVEVRPVQTPKGKTHEARMLDALSGVELVLKN